VFGSPRVRLSGHYALDPQLLTAARHVYEQAGFASPQARSDKSFGRDVVSEYWDMTFNQPSRQSRLGPGRACSRRAAASNRQNYMAEAVIGVDEISSRRRGRRRRARQAEDERRARHAGGRRDWIVDEPILAWLTM